MYNYIRRLLKKELSNEERIWMAYRDSELLSKSIEYDRYIPELFTFLRDNPDPYSKRDAYQVLHQIMHKNALDSQIVFLLKEAETDLVNRKICLMILRRLRIPSHLDLSALKKIVANDEIHKYVALAAFQGVDSNIYEGYLLSQIYNDKDDPFELLITKNVITEVFEENHHLRDAEYQNSP